MSEAVNIFVINDSIILVIVVILVLVTFLVIRSICVPRVIINQEFWRFFDIVFDNDGNQYPTTDTLYCNNNTMYNYCASFRKKDRSHKFGLSVPNM